MNSHARIETTIPGGWSASHLLRRGTHLVLTDLEGGGNAGMLIWAAWNKAERFNMADTLKAQHVARYFPGCVLYSDMGRVLMSVVSSNLDWHDALGGMGYPGLADKKYGPKRYQEHRNAYHRDLATGLEAETLRLGFTKADIHSSINWFSKIAVDERGQLSFVPGHSPAASSVVLRAEMDCLVVIAAAPHPLDTATSWAPKAIGLSLHSGQAASADDPCRTWCAENERGFYHTETFYS